jgi:hypothetical protein
MTARPVEIRALSDARAATNSLKRCGRMLDHRHVAQLDERRFPGPKDAGSSPVVTTNKESEPVG